MKNEKQKSEIALSYGDGEMPVRLPAGKQVDVYMPNDLPGLPDGTAEVRRAMAEPIDSPRLGELAQGKGSVAIVVDDVTRPVSNEQMLVPILEELIAAGISQEQITVVIATGLHRPATEQEARQLTGGLGLKVISHEASNPDEMVLIGKTSSGQKLWINRTVFEADLRILTGDVELHQFFGYGGGAKSVMPGISDASITRHNHSMMEAEGAGPGRFEGNPVRAEAEESADMLGVQFIINVVLSSRHEVVRAFAGDVHSAFKAGIKLVDEMYKVHVPHQYDAVLASAGGYPKDIELYQSQKAITSARRIVKKGGKLIVFAECREGHGSKLAYEWASQARSPEDIVKRHREKFVMGGHKAYQLARDVLWADVYLYSAMDPEVTKAFFLKPFEDLQLIETMLSSAESIAVLPKATLTLPVLPGQDKISF